MATAPDRTEAYRVTSINEAGSGRINISFVQQETDPTGAAFGTGNLTLNVSAEEAQGYYPGQIYNVTVSAA